MDSEEDTLLTTAGRRRWPAWLTWQNVGHRAKDLFEIGCLISAVFLFHTLLTRTEEVNSLHAKVVELTDKVQQIDELLAEAHLVLTNVTKIADDVHHSVAVIEAIQANVTNIAEIFFKPGTIIMNARGGPPPSQWLLCDGSAYSRINFKALFIVIGTTYGSGDGRTTFNVPDFRGRMLLGSGKGSNVTSYSLGGFGGSETHLMAIEEMPNHNHSIIVGSSIDDACDKSRYHKVAGQQFIDYLKAPSLAIRCAHRDGDMLHAYLFNTTSAGSNKPHNIMQPWAVANFIIHI